jgi:uncharacterized protein
MPSHSPSKHFRPLTRIVPLLVCLVLAWEASTRAAQVQSPQQVAAQAKTTGYVTDLAGVLSAGGRAKIEALCTELSQKAAAEIAVVTVKSIGDQTAQQYSFDVAEGIGIGPKLQGRGVLIFFATDDHKYFTQVGYDLEPILNDAKVVDFGREAVPDLRANDYDAALYLVTRRVADVIAADKGVTLTGAPLPRSDSRSNPHIPPFVIFIIIFVIYSIVRSIIAAGRGGPRGLGPRGGGGGWVAPFILGSMVGRGGGGFGGGGGGGGGGFGGFGGGGFGSGGGFGGGGGGGSW